MKRLMVYIILLISLSQLTMGDDLLGSDYAEWIDNAWLSSEENKLSMILPAVILLVTIVFAMIDLGAIGVTAGSILGLTVLVWLGIVYINPVVFVSYVALSVILIWKLGS